MGNVRRNVDPGPRDLAVQRKQDEVRLMGARPRSGSVRADLQERNRRMQRSVTKMPVWPVCDTRVPFHQAGMGFGDGLCR